MQNSLQKLFQFIFIFFHKITKMKIKSFECPKSVRNNEKKIMIGKSDTWLMSLLYRPLSKPVYYIVDWQISWPNQDPKLFQNWFCLFKLTDLIKLAVAHIQMHQLSPGLGAAQILSFQFHLCWLVMSQKLWPFSFHDNSLQDVGLSTNLAQTLWVRSWIHL